MRFRLLIALAIILVLVFGTGLFAAAGGEEPHCWFVSYTLEMRGKKVVKVPNTCIPCFGVCDYLPLPASGSRSGSVAVAR